MASRPGSGSNWGALVFVASFAALNWGAHQYHARMERRRAAELLVGDTVDRPGEVPRYDHSVGEHLDQYWSYIPDARQQRLAVLVGMSQMYSINDHTPEDRTISERMDDALSPAGTRVFGLAAPNMDNEEAVLYLLATALHPETRPSAFVYGVCFDKYRNTDIRPGLQNFMRQRPELLGAWKEVAERYRGRYPGATEKMLSSLHEIETASLKTGENNFEARLRQRASGVLPLVAARTSINAQLFSSLFELRNWVLHIKASTKRPIIGARYDLNRELLELLADEARARGIKLLPYVIPMNPTAETPYVESEYAAFKAWFADFANRHALPSADLDNIVPASEWGMRNGEPDFKHFKGAGHRVTADAVIGAFKADLVRTTR